VPFLLLAHFLSDQEFKGWGWRLPFLASSMLVMIGLYVRLALAETPVFAKVLQQHQQVGMPLKEILKSHVARWFWVRWRWWCVMRCSIFQRCFL
jgi:hypothetical protein